MHSLHRLLTLNLHSPHPPTPFVPPPPVAYNALLEICLKSDDTDRALDVIDRMADDGVEPDEMTVAVVAKKRNLRAYLRKRFA
jgi:pentatricopeptide repeat protein